MMGQTPPWTWSPGVGDAPSFTFLGWPASAVGWLRRLLTPAGVAGRPAGGEAVVAWRQVSHLPAQGPLERWVWQPPQQVSALQGKVAVGAREDGGLEVWVRGEEPEVLREVVGRLLPTLLGELALEQGWVLLHAAAVGWGGQALVFPGPGGAGKTTVYGAAALAGWPTLADDLVWLASTPGAELRAVGFPRGGWEDHLPPATARVLPLGAVVFPALGGEGERRLRRLPPHEALRQLWGQWVGLGRPGSGSRRFAALAEVVASVPAFAWVRPRWQGAA